MATDVRHTIAWELIKSLPDDKALVLLSFLVGYLWKEDKFYEGIAAWIENENRPKEKEGGCNEAV